MLRLKSILRDHIVHRIGDGMSTSLWFDNWHPICPLSDFINKRRIFRAGLSLEARVADVIQNGVWNWPNYLTELFDGLSVIPPPLLYEGKKDKVL